ncbi:MAG: ATP-binding protein [Phycisphaeraceae bacterium]|nr:ATP-binding protein [Phycisphaeraceae bacterium]MCW5763888.1 ATP-binding protein [Phycisphaeraceae bacterium]
MNEHPHIRVELLSNPAYLSGARELIASVCKRLGFDDLTCSKVALAVDEALCNVIRHGYKYAENRPIWISLWPLLDEHARPEGILLTIEDEADQVDPSCMKGRSLEDIKPGGLGVHIIRDVMDQVCYEKRESRGMRLVMSKRVPRTAAPARLGRNTESEGSVQSIDG